MPSSSGRYSKNQGTIDARKGMVRFTVSFTSLFGTMPQTRHERNERAFFSENARCSVSLQKALQSYYMHSVVCALLSLMALWDRGLLEEEAEDTKEMFDTVLLN